MEKLFTELWNIHAKETTKVLKALSENRDELCKPENALKTFRLVKHVFGEHTGDLQGLFEWCNVLYPQIDSKDAVPVVSTVKALQETLSEKVDQSFLNEESVNDSLRTSIEINKATFLVGLGKKQESLASFSELLQQVKAKKEEDFIKRIAMTANNICSGYLEHEDRQKDIALGFASIAKEAWYEVGTWMNKERAEWLVAKVLVDFNDSEGAEKVIKTGQSIVEENGKDMIEEVFFLDLKWQIYNKQNKEDHKKEVKNMIDVIVKAKEKEDWLPGMLESYK